MTTEISLCLATPDDCGHIAAMSNAIHAEHDYPGEPHSAESIHNMMFGPRPIIEALLAWQNGIPVGQAVFQPFYNPDHSKPGLWLTELYVAPDLRSAKLGHRLMAALAKLAQERDYFSIWWSVLHSNIAARRFYERVGAHNANALLYEIDGDRLANLASHFKR